MEYRALRYALVLTPHGWRWSVKRGQSEMAGTCPDRGAAIQGAQTVIDEQLRREAGPKVCKPEPSRASHFS